MFGANNISPRDASRTSERALDRHVDWKVSQRVGRTWHFRDLRLECSCRILKKGDVGLKHTTPH